MGNLSAALLFELFESPLAAKACNCFCQSSFSSFSSEAGDKTPESFFGVSENGTLRDFFTIYDSSHGSHDSLVYTFDTL